MELRQYNRELITHDAEDARQNLQQIRGGVLAGILRRPRSHDGQEVTDHKAFVKPLWHSADGSKAMEAIGELNYEGRKAFVRLLRLTRLLDHFDDEVVMAVAKALRVAHLTPGSEITASEDCFAIVVSGSLRVCLPRKHAKNRKNLRTLRAQVDVMEVAHAVPQPPPAATKNRARALATPRGSLHREQQCEILDGDRVSEEKLLLEHTTNLKLYDEVCELHVGDVFRPGSSRLVNNDGSFRLLTVEAGSQSTLVALVPTAHFNFCVQQWSTRSSRARSNGASSMTVGEMQDHLTRMPILNGISTAAACTLAHVAQELVPASVGPDAEVIRPAFASGYSSLTDQRVVVRQNAPSRSIYLLLSGPATVVCNHDSTRRLLAQERRAGTAGIQTASSRNMEEAEAVGCSEVPTEQPNNDDLYDSVR